MASNKPIVAHHRTGAYSLIVPNALKLRRSHSLQLFTTAGVSKVLRRSLSPDTAHQSHIFVLWVVMESSMCGSSQTSQYDFKRCSLFLDRAKCCDIPDGVKKCTSAHARIPRLADVRYWARAKRFIVYIALLRLIARPVIWEKVSRRAC